MSSKDTEYSWGEISQHNKRGDAWLVIEDNVYDVSSWSRRHPGGNVILNYAGEDATDPFIALHPDQSFSRKYLPAYKIGVLSPDSKQKRAKELEGSIVEDFRKIREEAIEDGLFKAQPWFYVWNLIHCIAFEVGAYLVLLYFGNGWIPWLIAGIMLATGQAQSGWTQHDYGHLSVLPNSKWNHWGHWLTIGVMKGAASSWWNWRHFNHHAKPNVVGKDFDIQAPYIFVLGKKPATHWGKSKKGIMPYSFQSKYWFAVAPPLLLPTFFHFENVYFLIKKFNWPDFVSTLSYFVRFWFVFSSVLGVGGMLKLYFFMRCLESHWFVWVTQMNHLPMDPNWDQHQDWPTLQSEATCNVESGIFNDWFTGHLNYQIEHHLFPTMPRHNYHKIAPKIEAMYKKHDIPYTTKSLWGAFADVVHSLDDYADAWRHAYYAA
jgi:fatty acid desaturase 2 (delta-6 desaturase)